MPFSSVKIALSSCRKDCASDGRNLDLADCVFAVIVEDVSLCSDSGVIAGKVKVDVDGVGGFIHDVAGRNCDVERVVPTAGMSDLDRVGTRFALHDNGYGLSMAAENARTDQQERTCGMGISGCAEV